MRTLQNLLTELSSGEDEIAETAVKKISEFGEKALPGLQELLSSTDPDTRWWALRAIAEIKSEKTCELLTEALLDPDPAVRQCAALGLRLNPHAPAVSRLVSALGDQDRLFASLAADALVAIGEEAVPALIEVVESAQRNAQIEAVRALAKIGDKRAIPVLFAVLGENSALMEYWADEGLERMGAGMVYFKP